MCSSCRAWHSKGVRQAAAALFPTSFLHIAHNPCFYLSALCQLVSRWWLTSASLARSISCPTQERLEGKEAPTTRQDAPMKDVSAPEGRRPAPAARRGPILGTRCKMGCYTCGATTSSKFRWWRGSILAPVLEKIEAVRPESDQICNHCYGTYSSTHPSTVIHEVCPPLDMQSIAKGHGLLLCVDEPGR